MLYIEELKNHPEYFEGTEKHTVFLLWKEFNFKKDNFLFHFEQEVVFFILH